ncbi:hypothetical protein FHX74_001122 [Friedmanniella endophytica]|uniref:Uncharacterized protein n=1 Tax=Microlunatus kandeliicorticis TaxID=1759536 RepID=A0A7W3IQS9_9ACTN|nr:hypothetical protein [Microlunatus kandeliicorticis]MBA8793517.1 hypothetical protein [Microlunatus kandeliicorticis]
MTYVRTDPSTMTPAELADYRARTGAAVPEDVVPGTTVEVRFDAAEHAEVSRRAEAEGLEVADYVRRVALA